MNATLNQLGSELFGSLSQLSIELAALALVVLLAARVLRTQPPALRHFLWVAVLLKPIVAVTISSPWTVFTPLLASLEPGWLAPGSLPLGSGIEATYATGAVVSTITGSPAPFTFAGWMGVLWILGSGLLMGRILIGFGVIRRLRIRAQIHRDGALFDTFRRARLALEIDSGVEVATSRSIHSPIALGILRPLVVVPADLLGKLRTDELEMILMHELAHVRRYDNLILLLQRLVTAALFFHPAVWLCGRMLRQEAEQACDDLVLNATGRSEDYARGLTSVAELTNLKMHLKRRIPIMNFFAATESDLARRIHRALSGGVRRMGTRSRVLAAVLICAMAAVTLPYSGIAQTQDDVDWETIKKTPPEEWSEELKAQIVAAGHDVDAIAERVRLGQAEKEDGKEADLDALGRRIRAAVESGAMTAEEGRRKMEEARRAIAGEPSREKRIWEAAMATDPDEWSDRLKAAILELKPDSTIEEIADGVRKRQQMARTRRDQDDGVDWEKVKTTPPEEWSEELKAQITAAGHDMDAIAERIRLGQVEKEDGKEADLDALGRRIRAAVESGAMTAEEGRRKMEEARQAVGGEPSREERIWKAAMATDPDEWSDRLKAAILEIAPGSTIEEIADAIRKRQQMAREGGDERLREFQRGVAERAMATDPDEWSDEMKEAIARAGWDLEDFTEGIRKRQQMAPESDDPQDDRLESRAGEDTAIQETSWGQVKKEIGDPK